MVNTAAPFGFRQFGQREGSAPTAGMETFRISSNDTNLYFTGDVVSLSTNSTNPGAIVVISSAIGTVAMAQSVLGVFQGCEYYNTAVGRVTWSSFYPGGNIQGDGKAYVCTNPEQLYIAQGTSGAVLQTSNRGTGCHPSVTGSSLGNQLSGQSIQTIMSSQITGLSSNATFRIVGLYADYAPPGVNGTSSGTEGLQIAVLQPNNWTRQQTVLLTTT